MLLRGRFGYAQAIYGSLFGTVLDNSGAVVPNAKVTVTDGSKGTQTVVQSNGEGFWRVENAQVSSSAVFISCPSARRSSHGLSRRGLQSQRRFHLAKRCALYTDLLRVRLGSRPR